VGVEKLHFRQNSENLGDRKCLGKPRTSFVGHPSAKFFQPFSDERVFQQPRLWLLKKSVFLKTAKKSGMENVYPSRERRL
jgi:hypothetical protein